MNLDFCQPISSPFLQHFPNDFHSKKISFESTLETFGLSQAIPCVATESAFAPSSLWSKFIFSSQHATPCEEYKPTSTSMTPFHPWRLIQKPFFLAKPKRDLHLVIHGISGGQMHPFFDFLVKFLREWRGSNVVIETLTSDDPPMYSSESIWLVPLLLLPGMHVRKEIPEIKKRLEKEGKRTKLVPFLGSWPEWTSMIENVVKQESILGNPILLHHPLGDGVQQRYLTYLSNRLNIPVDDWTNWIHLSVEDLAPYRPIIFSLAPNRHSKIFGKFTDISSLIEIDFLRFGLMDLLRLLP